MFHLRPLTTAAAIEGGLLQEAIVPYSAPQVGEGAGLEVPEDRVPVASSGIDLSDRHLMDIAGIGSGDTPGQELLPIADQPAVRPMSEPAADVVHSNSALGNLGPEDQTIELVRMRSLVEHLTERLERIEEGRSFGSASSGRFGYVDQVALERHFAQVEARNQSVQGQDARDSWSRSVPPLIPTPGLGTPGFGSLPSAQGSGSPIGGHPAFSGGATDSSPFVQASV